MSCTTGCGSTTPTQDACPITHTPAMVLKYVKDCNNWPTVDRACQIIEYNGNYHVTKVDNATGDPTLASNTMFTEALTFSDAILALVSACGG